MGFEVTAEAITIYLHQDATVELCSAENCCHDVKKIVGGNAVAS